MSDLLYGWKIIKMFKYFLDKDINNNVLMLYKVLFIVFIY